MSVTENLPSGWENYGAGEKIDWFNANQVTPGQLEAAGVSPTDIAWMQSQGYTGGASSPSSLTLDPRVAEGQYTLPNQRVGTMTERGDDYQIYEEVGKEGPLTYYQTYDAYGNKTGNPFALNTGDTLQDLIKAGTMFGSVVGGPAISSLIGGATGLTGSALAGATGAAIGGGGTLLTGGNLNDALKNAILGGVGSYAGAELLGTGGTSSSAGDIQQVTSDAAQLAKSGLSPSQIADVLEYSGYTPDLVDKGLASVIPSKATIRPTTPITADTSGMLITAPAPINIPSIVPGAVGGLLTANTAIPAVSGQNIEIVAPKDNTQITQKAEEPSIVVNPLNPVTTDLGNIEVKDTKIKEQEDQTTPTIVETPEVSAIVSPPINIPKIIADSGASSNGKIDWEKLMPALIKAVGSVSLANKLKKQIQQGKFVPPTNTGITYNDDYYNAIQRYYNSYLPDMPRDVITPLKNWYESKYSV